MLAQGKNWSNAREAREAKIGEVLGKTGIRESSSEAGKKYQD
jgi:hypothetical protein